MTSARRCALGACICVCAGARGARSTKARASTAVFMARLYRIAPSSHLPAMALLLRESEVEQLLTMPTTLELVERVHREYSTGNAIDVPRERTRLPKAALHILQGAVPSAGVFGYKAYTSSREGIRFLVYAFNAERGHLEVIVEAKYLGM